jgi:hypothetical protein
MIAQKRLSMKEAAIVIENAMRVFGCHAPVELIDHNTAIRIGTTNEHLLVRYENDLWMVSEYTPYFERTMSYISLEECAHDIAMCDERGVTFHRIDQTEREINEAIEEAELAFQH